MTFRNTDTGGTITGRQLYHLINNHGTIEWGGAVGERYDRAVIDRDSGPVEYVRVDDEEADEYGTTVINS